MDLYLPVDLSAIAPDFQVHWRDIHRSEPVELTQLGKEPLSVDDARTHLAVYHNDDDPWIALAITAVRRQVEYDMNRKLVAATMEMTFDHFPIERFLTLPLPPLISVASITGTDYAGVETTMSASDYLVDKNSAPGRIVLTPTAIWPAGTRPLLGGKIQWTAGPMANADRAVHAMKLLLGHYYENREAVTSGANRYAPVTYPLGYDALIGDRVQCFG